MVTTTSAATTATSVRGFGNCCERSNPASAMASTAVTVTVQPLGDGLGVTARKSDGSCQHDACMLCIEHRCLHLLIATFTTRDAWVTHGSGKSRRTKLSAVRA